MKRFPSGCIVDPPDARDWRPGSKQVARFLTKQAQLLVPSYADLRAMFPAVLNQGDMQTCTAHAATALIAFLKRQQGKESVELGSRLFNYKNARTLTGISGDIGASTRAAIATLALFGDLPEKFWPYTIQNVDLEPTGFCYSYAQTSKAVSYYRIDDNQADDYLLSCKRHLAASLPFTIGFPLFPSIVQSFQTSIIPVPAPSEKEVGSHLVVAVGFDDEKKALLVRNSWGKEWAADGYGWLPYGFFERRLVSDSWVLVSASWLEIKI